MKPKYKPVILALDEISISDAVEVISDLQDLVDIFKINSIIWDRQIETFVQDYNYLVNRIHGFDKKVFLDLKFHDIPSTMVSHAQKIANQVEFFTFHLSAGLNASLSMAKYQNAIGITVLSSLTDQDIRMIYNCSRLDLALTLTQLGVMSETTNFVSSSDMVEILKKEYPNVTLFVPGVTLNGIRNESQEVTAKWDQPIRDGADYIIMGRSILNLPRDERKGVIEKINAETLEIRSQFEQNS
jgi:orotidine-5'-phosphate decarboxylase